AKRGRTRRPMTSTPGTGSERSARNSSGCPPSGRRRHLGLSALLALVIASAHGGWKDDYASHWYEPHAGTRPTRWALVTGGSGGIGRSSSRTALPLSHRTGLRPVSSDETARRRRHGHCKVGRGGSRRVTSTPVAGRDCA